jgi:hypothetical protein
MSYVLEKAQEASRAIVPASDASRYLSPTPSASVVTFESRQLNLIDIGRRRASSQIRVPRVGSGVFAGISGTIFTVAPALPQHPFFATLVGTPGALSLLGMAFVASGVMFIATWIIEQTVDARIEFWASDDGLNAIARRLRHRYRDEGNELMFRRSEVINMIRGHAGIYRSIFPVFGLVSIDRQTAAGTADLQIEKMIAAGVAIPIAGRTLDPGFRLVDEEH